MFFASSDKFVGHWKENKEDGSGKYYKDGKIFSEGLWKHGFFESGKIFTSTYEGEWQNNTRNGVGIYRYGDGSIYDGFWVNGEKNGKGKY